MLHVPIAMNVMMVYAKSASAVRIATMTLIVITVLSAKLASVFLSATPRVTVIQVLNAKQASAGLCVVTLITRKNAVKALYATNSTPWKLVSLSVTSPKNAMAV